RLWRAPPVALVLPRIAGDRLPAVDPLPPLGLRGALAGMAKGSHRAGPRRPGRAARSGRREARPWLRGGVSRGMARPSSRRALARRLEAVDLPASADARPGAARRGLVARSAGERRGAPRTRNPLGRRA